MTATREKRTRGNHWGVTRTPPGATRAHPED